MSAQDFAKLRVRLDDHLIDEQSVVARLNDLEGTVAAHLDGEVIAIRPRNQPMLAGMPAYSSGRPEFRGQLIREGGDAVTLSGAVRHSDFPILVTIAGGAVAALGAFTGSLIVISGDVTGIAAIIISVITGAGVMIGGFVFGRISAKDEQSIRAALTALAEVSS